MARRFGLGPVFYFECLTNARRWQLFALRTVAAALPGIALFLVCWATLHGRPVTVSNLASTGESFFFALVGTQLALILLAAPAYTAGAICLDKERGTLLHVLVTDLSNTEIILGKLGVRLLAVLGLVFAVVPVLFGAILLGGIDPAAALGAILVSLGVALWTSALALTLSVWMRKTYEVLLIVYLFLALLLLLVPIWLLFQILLGIPSLPDGVKMSNPFWLAYLPYLRPGTACLSDQAIFLAAALGVSALLCGLAVWRVRMVAISQSARVQRRTHSFSLWRGLLGPSLDFNPVLWREWHRKRPSRWGLLVWMAYWTLALLCSLFTIMALSKDHYNRAWAIPANILQVLFGLLLLSVASVTSLAEERVRGSLDMLLTTPLSACQILMGKWWGAYRPVLFMTILPALTTVAASSSLWILLGLPLLVGLILAYGAALTSLGLVLALWIARPGRAQVVSVFVFIMMVIAPLLPLFISYKREMEDFALASPIYGVGNLTASLVIDIISRHDDRVQKILFWSFVWLGLYLGAALLLFLLSLRTFDSCLGRVSRTSSARFPLNQP